MRMLVLILGFALRLCAVQVDNHIVDNKHYIKDHYVYQGDREGHYYGDRALVLDDGSHWKVYYEDAPIATRWEKTHPIRIEQRTDWLCYKPNHLFNLYNAAFDETVRVMFVQNTKQPIKISKAHGRNFTLSDGTRWAFCAGNERFLEAGTRVYLFPYYLSPHIFVLVIGKERETDAVLVSNLTWRAG